MSPHRYAGQKGIDGARVPKYVPRAEAAQIIGCSVRHLERLALQGGGPPYCLHGRRRAVYEVGQLAAWMESRTVISTSDATVRGQTGKAA